MLQVLQKVTVRARNRTLDEPFALNFKALKVRLELVHGLAGKVGNAKSKPTAMSVSGWSRSAPAGPRKAQRAFVCRLGGNGSGFVGLWVCVWGGGRGSWGARLV